MNPDIALQPVEMTPEVMGMLEEKGLILRLRPGAHPLDAAPGETIGETLYASEPALGGHMLIAVAVNRPTFAAFGTHPDNEEFLLIGNPDTQPMFLVVALCLREELDRKIADSTVSAEDFVCLRVRYNDPEVCFFTMLKDVPHGEAIVDAGKPPALFYVTEPSNMGIDLTDFGAYELKVTL